MFITRTLLMTLFTWFNVIITEVKAVGVQRTLLNEIIVKLIKKFLYYSILTTSIWHYKNFKSNLYLIFVCVLQYCHYTNFKSNFILDFCIGTSTWSLYKFQV